MGAEAKAEAEAEAEAEADAEADAEAEAGGCRGDELFDALGDLPVFCSGALGARFKLLELRLLCRDWASKRPSLVTE